MSLSSRDSEPGLGTLPHEELLLILVKFLGMEQVPLSVLEKTLCARGSCLLAFIMPAVAFILAAPVTLSRRSSPRSGWHIPPTGMFPEPLVAPCGARGWGRRQIRAAVGACPGVPSGQLCSSLTCAGCPCPSSPAVQLPGWQLLGHKHSGLVPPLEPVCASLALSPEGTAQHVAA